MQFSCNNNYLEFYTIKLENFPNSCVEELEFPKCFKKTGSIKSRTLIKFPWINLSRRLIIIKNFLIIHKLIIFN